MLSSGKSSKDVCVIQSRRKYYAKKTKYKYYYYIIGIQKLYKDEQYTSI
jgi:hypothetical protein